MPGKRGAKSAEEAEDFTALDDPDLRDRLNAMPLGAQVDLFRGSDWQERVKIAKNSDLADQIVASMPDEEILLTFKGAGEESGLGLIAHCNESQLRFILDIDLWNEYAVDEERVLKWLNYLLASGEKTVADFVHACDIELVIVFLGKLIRLIPFDDAVEMGEELTSIVPDEAFVVQSLVPEETPAIRLLLTTIMADDRELYSELRYLTYRAIATEAEEEAYRWRNSRLEEKGILEYGEAAAIYESLPETDVRALIKGIDRPYYRGAGDIQVPAFYPLRLSGSRPLYYELLEALDDDGLRNRIAGDVSYVTNRLLVADGQTVGDVDATRIALSRLFSLANIGLLHMAGETRKAPAELLKGISISDLFRIGLGLVTGLRSEADEVAGRCPPVPGFGEYALFEDYHVGVLNGLRMKLPQHYEPGATAAEDYRDFRTVEEVATARAVVAQISVLVEACYEKLGVLGSLSRDAGRANPGGAAGSRDGTEVAGCSVVAAGGADFGNLLSTAFAHFVVSGKFDVAPLGRRELRSFLDAAFIESDGESRVLDPGAAEKFVTWIEHRTGFRGHKRAILEAYVMERLEKLEEDLAGASSGRGVDPLIVNSILLAK
jgi:hypothetical protein